MEITKKKLSGLGRRTLEKIDRYPSPSQITQRIQNNKWYYKINVAYYEARDKALCSLLYIAALRISEARRLRKNQFLKIKPGTILKLESVKLSKATRTHTNKKTGEVKVIMRKQEFRPEIFIPLDGERGKLGQYIDAYLEFLEDDDLLFQIKNRRIHQIVTAIMGVPPHWLRAFGENFLYDAWEHDILAVADYVSVDARTLALYIKRRYLKYLKEGIK